MIAEPVLTQPPRTIGLIGGTGKMGQMFQKLFEGDGYRVLVVGRAALADYERLVRDSDVVLITVPIRDTVPLLRAIKGFLRQDQLLTDFTSIKSEPVSAMLESPAMVIGCHPIFAPMADPSGQNVVLCPERPGGYLPWYRKFYEDHGMRVAEMTPRDHDQSMAFIQGLTHFLNIAFAGTLRGAGVDVQQLLQVCSPVYRIFFSMLCRILSGDAELYGQIQISNPANVPLLEEFLKNANSLMGLIEDENLEGFYEAFRNAADYLGDYKDIARNESNFLIEQIKTYPHPAEAAPDKSDDN